MGGDRFTSAKERLADRAEELALYLFGKPTYRNRIEMRWGRKGSMRLKLRGKNGPTFYDFSEGRGGSMLDMVMVGNDLHSSWAALEWAETWLGDGATARRKEEPRRNDTPDPEAEKEAKARAIWDASKPLMGTAGEAYLHRRHIRPERWPTFVRWNPGGFLVFATTSPDNRTTAIQRVYINQDGTPVTDDDGKGGRTKRKRSLGPRYGGAVRFSGSNRPDVLILAEGPETALSIWFATGIETWSTIGPTHTVDLSPVPLTRTILVALDDDERNASVAKRTREKIRAWRKGNRTVLTAMPWAASKRDKSDFNDSLAAHGPAYVRERIEDALTVRAPASSKRKIAEARDELMRLMDAAATELRATAPDADELPAIAFKVGVGTGKTEAAMRVAIKAMCDGDRRTVVVAVPDNQLSSQLFDRASAIRDEMGGNFGIGIYRGREANNPDQPGEKMCEHLDVVRAVQEVGGDVQAMVCRNRTTGLTCPLYATCAYQRQRRERKRLVFTSHATLFTDKPAGILTPSMVVIDEAFWQMGIWGTDHRAPSLVREADLTGGIKVAREKGRDLFGNKQASVEASVAADLQPARDKLRKMLKAKPGPLRRELVEAVGLTVAECRTASKMEYSTLVPVKVKPNMSPAQFQAAIAAAAPNPLILKRAALFRAVADFIDAGVQASGCVFITSTDEGAAFRTQGRKDIRKSWSAPTLILDATLRPELARLWFPNLRVAAEIEAEAPHQRVVQHYTRSFARSHFGRYAKGHGFQANRKAVDALWRWAKLEAMKVGGTGLVVVQKAVEEAIRANHRLPSFLDIAHHNAVKGRDDWRNVSTLTVAGRTLPPPDAVEAMAMALGGEWIDPAILPTEKNGTRWYAATPVTVADNAGNTITLTAERHPNALAEQVRAAIAEDELIQIIGRARGANRGPNNPVTVHVLADMPLPLQVDEFRAWEAPGLDAAMLTEGVWIESAADAERCWPGLVPNAQAVKNERRSVHFPYNNILYGNYTHFGLVTYLKPGQGQKPVVALYDRRAIPNIAAWLEQRLGTLAYVAEVKIPGTASEPATDGAQATPSKPKAKRRPTPKPAVEPPPEPLEPILVKPPLDGWTGGKMPPELVVELRKHMRATGYRQHDIAEAIGLSRPQLTNALVGRFGLSATAAERLKQFLATPPDGPVQSNLI